MPCYSPLKGWRSKHVNPTGRRSVVFNPKDGFRDLPVEVPCGQCIGCRLEYSRQWAIRCMHEASLHSENSFITLTFAPEHVPQNYSLDKRHFQLFMKRLRKHYAGRRISYYHCGEYGAKFGRPHYHAILFGLDFEDRQVDKVSGSGHRIYRSATLEKIWPFGLAWIGDVTFESAAYVARYVMKKQTGKAAAAHYEWIDPTTGEIHQRQPEYATMSLKPPIGAGWFEKYKHEVFPADEVIVNGKAVKPPKFYLDRYEVEYPEDAAKVIDARKRSAARRKADSTPDRLAVREQVKRSQIARLRRDIE